MPHRARTARARACDVTFRVSHSNAARKYIIYISPAVARAYVVLRFNAVRHIVTTRLKCR
jgi:hypothetical protein